MDADLAIHVEGLRKRFGPIRALDGIDLATPPGRVLALLGPNGAGKTTAVRILTTLTQPDHGTVRVAGHDVVSHPAQVRAAVGLAGQQAAVDPLLTGRENLELIATLHHLGRREARRRVSGLLERFGLDALADRRAGAWSGGMRRRLDLAASLVGRPRVLVLDEPTAGLDPASRHDLWATVRALVAEGTTALLTTQYLDEADELADHIVVIDAGRVIAAGSTDELKAQVGGHRIAVRLAAADDLAVAAGVVSDLASGPLDRDERTATLVIPIAGGAAPVAEVVRRLDAAHLGIDDLVVRHPSLDDVFLTLTAPSGEGRRSAAPGRPEPVPVAPGHAPADRRGA